MLISWRDFCVYFDEKLAKKTMINLNFMGLLTRFCGYA